VEYILTWWYCSLRCAGSMSPSDQPGGAKTKASNTSKIPMLRRRSASLSRPGSRCSRPPSRTDSQPNERSESMVPTSGWKTHPGSVPVVATDGPLARRNSDSAAGNRNRRGKSPVADDDDGKTRKNSESAVAVGKNSPGRQNLDLAMMSDDEANDLVTTDPLNLSCRGRTHGDGAKAVGAASKEDHILHQKSPGDQGSDSLSIVERETPSRRERRSCSLDRSQSWKRTR